MAGPSFLPASQMPQVIDGAAFAKHLRTAGLSCRAVSAPGTLATWGAIYLADPADLMRVCVLLEHHPHVLDLAESRDRLAEGWPLWFRVAATAPPGRVSP